MRVSLFEQLIIVLFLEYFILYLINHLELRLKCFRSFNLVLFEIIYQRNLPNLVVNVKRGKPQTSIKSKIAEFYVIFLSISQLNPNLTI